MFAFSLLLSHQICEIEKNSLKYKFSAFIKPCDEPIMNEIIYLYKHSEFNNNFLNNKYTHGIEMLQYF
jgi:hypothetical protein